MGRGPVRGDRRLALGALILGACAGTLFDGSVAGEATAEERPSDVEDSGEERVVGPGEDTGQPERLCALSLSCSQEIPDEPEVPCWFSVIDGYGRLEYEGWAGVELRGRSSLNAPKHQYGVELWADETGSETVSVDLGGLGAESDWVLNGAYYDRSLFRNALAFELFAAMGHYAPGLRFCSLALDGDELGIYHLVERVKRDDDRLDLAEEEGSGERFVLYLDDEDGFENTLGYGSWRFVYPHPERLPEGTSEAVEAWLSGWQEEVAGGGTGLGWLDLSASVDLVLLEELAKNNDAYYLSLYLWRDGGAAEWVPWDLDLSFGQPSYNDNENPETWIAYRPDFVAALGGWELFRARMEERWEELRTGPFADETILARIDRFLEVMEPGLETNWEVWEITEIQFGGYLYEVESYEDEVARVRAWIPERLAWMDEAIGSW